MGPQSRRSRNFVAASGEGNRARELGGTDTSVSCVTAVGGVVSAGRAWSGQMAVAVFPRALGEAPLEIPSSLRASTWHPSFFASFSPDGRNRPGPGLEGQSRHFPVLPVQSETEAVLALEKEFVF